MRLLRFTDFVAESGPPNGAPPDSFPNELTREFFTSVVELYYGGPRGRAKENYAKFCHALERFSAKHGQFDEPTLAAMDALEDALSDDSFTDGVETPRQLSVAWNAAVKRANK